MQARVSVGGAVQPGVDLGDAGGRSPAAVGGGFPQRTLVFRRAEGASVEGQDRFRLAGRLDLQPVQPGLELKLPGEGVALVGPGAQAVDLIAVLVRLIAVQVDADAGGRIGRRDLGPRRSGDGGGESERQEDQGCLLYTSDAADE